MNQDVKVNINEEKKGLELLFSKKLNPEDAEYLKNYVGFKITVDPLKWYTKYFNNPAYLQYADALKQSINIQKAETTPSFEANLQNLDQGKFVLADYSFKKEEKTASDSLIIFENTPIAKHIAQLVGQEKYGDQLKGVSLKKTGIKRKGLEHLKKKQFIDNSYRFERNETVNENQSTVISEETSQISNQLTDGDARHFPFTLDSFSDDGKYYKTINGSLTLSKKGKQVNYYLAIEGVNLLGSALNMPIGSQFGNTQITDIVLSDESNPKDAIYLKILDQGKTENVALKDFLLTYFNKTLNSYRISKSEFERINSQSQTSIEGFINQIKEELLYLDHSLKDEEIDQLLNNHQELIENHFSRQINERLETNEIAYFLLEKQQKTNSLEIAENQPSLNKSNSNAKIPIKEILLTTEGFSWNPDFIAGQRYDNWQQADAFMDRYLGKVSDIHYQLTWQDGSQWSGSVDMEPADFHAGKKILTSWVTTFLKSLSQAEPDELASEETIKNAQKLIEGYSFSDSDTVSTNPTPTQKPLTFQEVFLRFSEYNKRKIEDPLPTVNDFNSWINAQYPAMDDDQSKSFMDEYKHYLEQSEKRNRWLDNLGRKKSSRTIYNFIYDKLFKLLPDLTHHLKQQTPYGKSSLGWPDSGLMDLYYNYLMAEDTSHIISLAHNYVQNGDLIADPDMEIRINPTENTAEALTFQDLYSFKRVYKLEDGKTYVNSKLKIDLNKFLNTWLANALKQGHKIQFEQEESLDVEAHLENGSQSTEKEVSKIGDQAENIDSTSSNPVDQHLSDFDTYYENEQYDEATAELLRVIDLIIKGQHLHSLPEVITRFGLKGIKPIMKKVGFYDLTMITDDARFLENLDRNLWDLIPDQYKKVRNEKPLKFKADPKDENLQKIMAPFVGNYEIRVEEMGVYFDDYGMVATDRIKLLFIPEVSPNIRGSFCLTKKCEKNFNDGYDEIYGVEPFDQQVHKKFQASVSFPDYKKLIEELEIIPIDTVNLSALRVFCNALIKSHLIENNHKVHLRFSSGFIGVDPKHLSAVATSFLRLGLSEISISCKSSTSPILCFEKGKQQDVKTLTATFGVLMPVQIKQTQETDKVDGLGWVQTVDDGIMYFDATDQQVKTYRNKPQLTDKDAEQNQPIDQSNEQTKNEQFEKQLIAVSSELFDMYREGIRPTKGKITQLAKELDIPNMGQMWEMTEYSWLKYYQLINLELAPFADRLSKMIAFWQHLQPSYDYSDSSKELYKQYSTPCPIGAIIAQYCFMDRAESIFDPSAGNGLLVMGADPAKTYVNEIDPTRRAILEFQNFKKVTSVNAVEPFDKSLDNSFDVVVTNPPFTRWEEDQFDKKYLVKKYFNSYRGLSQHMRLEHLMCGLALHTLKNDGKAALIILGHIYFDRNGLIAKYRPFFNWLCAHYYVDDIINLNGFKLYNKQGAVAQTMLILISGRKPVPFGVAPNQKQTPGIDQVVESFTELWKRVEASIQTDIKEMIRKMETVT